MDTWIIVASSALKFMQSITKKNTRQSAGHPEMTRRAFKNKKSLQISGFGQNDTKSHLKQKNIFLAKKVLKKSLSLISTFTLVSTTTKADFSATN